MPKKKTNDVKEEIKKIVKKKKPGRKPKRKVYFGMEVQDAIVRYNTSEDDGERNKIYQQEIHKAFDKLAENIINTFKFTYFDYGFNDIKHETVAFMVINIHKYDHTKGSKAFSYFSVVAKNYLILHNNNNYKKLKMYDDIDLMKDRLSFGNAEHEETINDLTHEVIKYFETNITNIFKKKRDIDIAYAILKLFQIRKDIENFNKKALYVLIREMTGVNTIHITSVINVFKKHYKLILSNYHKKGYAVDNNLNKFFN